MIAKVVSPFIQFRKVEYMNLDKFLKLVDNKMTWGDVF